MCTDYRESMLNSRMTGNAMNFSYKEHCKEAVLKQLINNTATESANEDMLWILKHSEKMERGIYSWNQPQVDLAIIAPPALMALIMGEYELAVQLCKMQEAPLWENTVEELYQEGDHSQIGGGSYNFCEACLFSDTMGECETRYFWENGYYDARLLVGENNGMLSDMQFHGKAENRTEDIWRPLQKIQSLGDRIGDTDELLHLAVLYALQLEIDTQYENFWERLYAMFSAREEHLIIIDAMHSYFLNTSSADNLPLHFEERVLKGIQKYFNYEEWIPMSGAVETYLIERITSKTYLIGKRKWILESYFHAVKQFEGTISEKWKYAMLILLSSYNSNWWNKGFQNGFLRKDCTEDYIDYLLQEYGREYGSYIARLIQIKWRDTISK